MVSFISPSSACETRGPPAGVKERETSAGIEMDRKDNFEIYSKQIGRDGAH